MCDRCSYCNDGTLLPRLWLTLWWKKRKATVANLACEAHHWFRDGECKTRNTVPDSSTQSHITQYIFPEDFWYFYPHQLFPLIILFFCLFVWCVQMIEPCLRCADCWITLIYSSVLEKPVKSCRKQVPLLGWLEWTVNHSFDGWPVCL